tara:strand:+ start:7466 stop:7747 length:282 start_codon:yes stop_codon:yes gene_type:complete
MNSTQHTEIIEKLVSFLKKKNIKISDENFAENYLENKYLDSLDMVEFITFIEEEFRIKLTEEDYQKKELFNIQGLTRIILKKIECTITQKKNL